MAFFGIAAPPGFQALTLSFRGWATGPLRPAFGVPQGTPGDLVVSQTGLLATARIANPNSRVVLDGFPAELVDHHVIGQPNRTRWLISADPVEDRTLVSQARGVVWCNSGRGLLPGSRDGAG